MYLGLRLNQDNNNLFQDAGNFASLQWTLLDNIKRLRYQYHSFMGKVVLIKTMIASVLVYRFSLLPTPSKMVLSNIDQQLFALLWDYGRPSIQKKVLVPPQTLVH